jgi:hypothetical protein
LNALAVVKGLQAPVLFLAAARDPDRAAESARRLEAAASQPKQLEIYENSGAHGTDLVQDPRAAAEIAQFLIDHRR